MAATVARSILAVRSSSSSYFIFSKSLLSSSSSIAKSPHLPGFTRPARSTFSFYHSLRDFTPGAVQIDPNPFIVKPSGGAYSPLNSGSHFSDRPLFPGCDYEHWLIVVDKPCGEGATKEQMIECYIQTLAKVLGSEEEAKKKIYNVTFERHFGFGCEITRRRRINLKVCLVFCLSFPISMLMLRTKTMERSCL